MDRVVGLADRTPRDPHYHFAISWREEHLDHNIIWDAVDTSLRSLKLNDHQWLAAIHGDTAHTHAHVLVNRIHPQSLKFWPRGKDVATLIEALGISQSRAVENTTAWGARTFEIQTGQKSFQRWLRESVAPIVDDMLTNGETWGTVQGKLAREFGVGIERGRDGLLLVDNSPLRYRRGSAYRPLTIPITALRLPHDFDGLDRAWELMGVARPAVDHDRGYVAAYVAYKLPIPQVQHPAVAPLYDRFLEYRQDLVDTKHEEFGRQRSLIALTRRIRIEEVRREWAEGSADYLRTATPADRRFFHEVTAPVFKDVEKLEIEELREEARRQIADVEARYGHPLFRNWLKYQISVGDQDAKNALFYVRTGMVRAVSLSQQRKESPIVADVAGSESHSFESVIAELPDLDELAAAAARDGIRDGDADVSAPKTAKKLDYPELEVEQDGIRRRSGARVRRKSSIDAALEAFGDQEAARALVMRYRSYLAEFVARDPTRLNASQGSLSDQRRRALERWSHDEKAGIEQLPETAQPVANALHLARQLRNEAAAEEARGLQQAVVENVVHRSRAMPIHAFLESLDEPEAKRLAKLMPLNATFAYPTFEPTIARDRRFLKDLEAKQVGNSVEFRHAGSLAFTDTGEHVLAKSGATRDGDRAALEYAAAKFGNEIELTGSIGYKKRMLALAVEIGLHVSNDELAVEQQKLIEQKRATEPVARTLPAPSDLSRRFDAVFDDQEIHPDHRQAEIQAIMRAAVELEVRKTRPAIALASGGAVGKLENLVMFHSAAFAVVKNANGEHLVELPRELAEKLVTEIGQEHDLTRKRIDERTATPTTLDELVRRADESVEREAEPERKGRGRTRETNAGGRRR
jgi:hypothetical protein